MLASSSNNPISGLGSDRAAFKATELPWRGRLLMLGLNFIPLLHVVAPCILIFWPKVDWPFRILMAFGFLYLAPAVAGRVVGMLGAIPKGRIQIGSSAFFRWWGLFQLQVLFSRLPVLEEVLRLVPGLYSQWLRLWGARIGRLTYWSPGTLITDRSFLDIGDDVVFGAGVRLNSHVMAREEGKIQLLLANVKVGDRVVVGGYSLLTAGTEIMPDEVTRAFLISPPFSVWKDGKRLREHGYDE